MSLEGASEHEIYELLKLQDAEAWRLAWENAVLPEARSLRSGQMARRFGITAEEMMSLLYVEMIGGGKINLFRDDGGSLWGWMRTYVRGYVHQADPAKRREISLEGADFGDESDGGANFEDKVSKMVSDSRGRDASPLEDPAMRRKEEWELVQKCFGEMWKRNPMRAYVHLLKLRMNLSSAEIKDMLGVTSEANVDQTFSRALRDMRELKAKHERDA